MLDKFNIDEKLLKLTEEAEKELEPIFKKFEKNEIGVIFVIVGFIVKKNRIKKIRRSGLQVLHLRHIALL